ncbi:hypothetical protein [Simiduia agarivorans]|uniref:HDOD domain-containing protein n=1 Tax=Simiduia agarivorans (strain DSM 21679 / JCM 13881 / BCRC 17597 / SA1) TaxID=1117647 RepID=K4KPD9_SIMAS|nr:hypothetical protein [Simiduia agarivorans]AFV00101.1 hypothetical protein M5M_14830 [Simiduia agarivorans SA1 = DSM 21679]
MTHPIETLQLPPPKGLDHWRAQLVCKKLTLLPGSYDRIKRALQGINSNADKVALAIAADPAACLHFFLRANQLVSRTGNEIHNLAHLVSLLGYPQCNQLLAALPVAERPLPFYWRQLQEGLLRTTLLHKLPLGQSGIDAQQLHFSVLFSGLPHWLCWHSAAREELNRAGLARNPRIGPAKATQLVYGQPLPWSQWLGREALPKPLLETLAIKPAEWRAQARALLRAAKGLAFDPIAHRRHALVFLLDQLGRQFMQAPMHPRVNRLVRMLAQLLQTSADKVSGCLHQAAGELDAVHHSLVDQHPARALLAGARHRPAGPVYALPKAPQSRDAKPAPIAPKDTPTAAGTARLLDNRFRNADIVKRELADLARGHERLQSLNHLLNSWLSGCADGMGMAVCAVLIPDKNRQHWLARFQNPAGDLATLKTSALLDKLCEKTASVFINDDNRDAMRPHLPAELAVLSQTNHLLLHSLVMQRKPVALLLCAEPDLSPPRLRALKQLNLALQTATERLAMKLRRQVASG